MLAIYKRELKSYFLTPIGYIFCGVFLLASGLLFSYSTLLDQSTESLGTYFLYLIAVFAILIPLLTMKLLSDDRRTRTEQLLITSPVSVTGMIMGKYLAAVTVFGATFLVNAFNFVLLYRYGAPNTAGIFANILGVFLIGIAFIAIGTFLSAITESQLIAAVSTMGVIGAILLISFLADKITTEWVRVVLKWFSIIDRYRPFVNQMLDIPAVIYFCSLAAIFLFLTVRVYEKRRWS